MSEKLASIKKVGGGGGGNYEVVLDGTTAISAPVGVWVGSILTLNKGIYFYNPRLYPYYSTICEFRDIPSNPNVNVLFRTIKSNVYLSGSSWKITNPLEQFIIFEVTADNTQVDLSCCANGYSREGTLYEYLAKM